MSSEALLHPSIPAAGLIAVMGYVVVFFGIILLLIVVVVMGKVMAASSKRAAAKAAAAAPAAGSAPSAGAVSPPEARGAAGEVKLHDVDDRDAAIIMAIVAHQLQVPINRLRFRSIKEVKDK